MKKFIAFIAAAVAFAGVATACEKSADAGDDRIVAFEKLPARARDFIARNYSGKKVSYVKQDRDFVEVTYEVVFADAARLEFDSDGEWTEIDERNSPVADAYVPSYITSYVTANYPGSFVVRIEKDKRGTEVKLNNGLELTFDKNGNLVEIDD